MSMCVFRLALLLAAAILLFIEPASFATRKLHPPWINRPTRGEHARSPSVKRIAREAQLDSPNIEERYGPWASNPNSFGNGFNWNDRSNRRNDNRRRNRPSSETIFFRDDDDFLNPNLIQPVTTPLSTSTQQATTVAIPGMGTPRSACEDACLVTSEYNPICGSNSQTYDNMGRLNCAQNCGKRVRLLYYGSCTRVPPN